MQHCAKVLCFRTRNLWLDFWQQNVNEVDIHKVIWGWTKYLQSAAKKWKRCVQHVGKVCLATLLFPQALMHQSWSANTNKSFKLICLPCLERYLQQCICNDMQLRPATYCCHEHPQSEWLQDDVCAYLPAFKACISSKAGAAPAIIRNCINFSDTFVFALAGMHVWV